MAGIDEVGRGPLAGPVMVAAVILPARYRLPGLDDSKALTAKVRERLYRALTTDRRVTFALGYASAAEIDRINILEATHRAMARALAALPVGADHALVDGRPVQALAVPQTALVGGDALSASIAAASVIAKVVRDRLMDGWHRRFPQYAFDRHKGYGTKEHLERLAQHGPCPIHRRSFAPVALAHTPAPLGAWPER